METQEQHLLNEALRSIEALRADLKVLDARVKTLEADALSDHGGTGPTPPVVIYPYYPLPQPFPVPWITPYTISTSTSRIRFDMGGVRDEGWRQF